MKKNTYNKARWRKSQAATGSQFISTKLEADVAEMMRQAINKGTTQQELVNAAIRCFLQA